MWYNVRAYVLASYVCVLAPIFTKIIVEIHYYHLSVIFKFHKDPIIRCRDICKIILTFVLSLFFNVLSKPQPYLNLTSTQRLGFTRKWLYNHHHHPPTQTQCQQYLSCDWPDFDETLKVGSCEHLEPIPTVRVTFVHATFVLPTFVHIRNISAVTDSILMKLYR